MSLFTSKMKLLAAVVLEDTSDEIARELLKLGLLDFVEVSSLIDSDDIRLKNTQDDSAPEVIELRKKLETIYRQAELAHPYQSTLTIDQMSSLDLVSSRKKIEKAEKDLQILRDRQKKLHQEKLKLNEIREYFLKSGPTVSISGNSFLLVHKGRPGRGNYDDMIARFGSIPHFGMENPDTGNYFIVTLRRDKSIVDDVFDKFQWIEDDEQINTEREEQILIEKIHKDTERIESEIEKTRIEMNKRVMLDKDIFDGLWKNLRIHELYGNVRDNFAHTERTCLFSGWLPAKNAEKIEDAIKRVCGSECIIEWSEPQDFKREAVPVELKHARALAPFQMLVENYAVPEYGTVDPTLFVAISYMIMFGLMFGDAGQGLVILLIGALGGKFMKDMSVGVKNLLRLLVYCGSASIITGILFGSYFGYQLFQPLWFDYHAAVSGSSTVGSGNINDVYDILRITIYFGITVIGTGLIINWINLYKKRDYFTLFLDKSGILGGWFYGCGVYTAFYFVGTEYRTLPDADLLSIFFGIPVIILFFKAPLHFILHERKHKQFSTFTIIDFIMEWIVELLEIFSGYLANTLSFMRVAGLGIAHVSLMVAFDTIAGLSGGAGSVIILILGNMLVIALEGLSAGIQALRLNYYEFFSRYFTGKGIAYNPVSLRNRKQEG